MSPPANAALVVIGGGKNGIPVSSSAGPAVTTSKSSSRSKSRSPPPASAKTPAATAAIVIVHHHHNNGRSNKSRHASPEGGNLSESSISFHENEVQKREQHAVPGVPRACERPRDVNVPFSVSANLPPQSQSRTASAAAAGRNSDFMKEQQQHQQQHQDQQAQHHSHPHQQQHHHHFQHHQHFQPHQYFQQPPQHQPHFQHQHYHHQKLQQQQQQLQQQKQQQQQQQQKQQQQQLQLQQQQQQLQLQQTQPVHHRSRTPAERKQTGSSQSVFIAAGAECSVPNTPHPHRQIAAAKVDHPPAKRPSSAFDRPARTLPRPLRGGAVKQRVYSPPPPISSSHWAVAPLASMDARILRSSSRESGSSSAASARGFAKSAFDTGGGRGRGSDKQGRTPEGEVKFQTQG
jgi:hypothetical protein